MCGGVGWGEEVDFKASSSYTLFCTNKYGNVERLKSVR